VRPETLYSFFDELEKVAFGEEEAMRVAGLAKKLQVNVPTRISKRLGIGPMSAHQSVSGMLQRGKELFKKFTGPVRPEFRQQLAETGRDQVVRAAVKQPAAALAGHTPRIFQAPGAVSEIRRGVDEAHVRQLPKMRDPANNRILQGVIKGHELDELGSTSVVREHNPAVIFKEHNRVATLPESAAPVKQFMKGMRNFPAHGDREYFAPYGLKYGESPRLSRHAIRRLTESLESKRLASMPPRMRAQNLQTAGIPYHPPFVGQAQVVR